MNGQKQTELELIIVAPDRNPRELGELRSGLFEELERELSSEAVQLDQIADSRAVDPAIVGAIWAMITPIVLDKLGDILVEWVNRRNDCLITVEIPIPGAKPIVVTYNPNDISGEKFKESMATAVEIAQSFDDS